MLRLSGGLFDGFRKYLWLRLRRLNQVEEVLLHLEEAALHVEEPANPSATAGWRWSKIRGDAYLT